MADLLIKGEKMPETCGFCPCICSLSEDDHDYYCGIFIGKFVGFFDRPSDHEWCPLVEVPTHKTLIDEDAFTDSLIKEICDNCNGGDNGECHDCKIMTVYQLLDYAPTVIEASKDGEQDG